MNVAVYGGSFNPPHLSHQLAITCVLSTARVDELWMVPTFKHPFDKPLAPFDDRVRMCERAAAPFARVRVSRIEEELGRERDERGRQIASYTLRTLQALKERHAEHAFALVIGADLVVERERWHGWAELSKLGRFIVVGRQGAPSPGGVELPAISSTDVRRRLASGAPVEDLVDASVLEYIAERGLYR